MHDYDTISKLLEIIATKLGYDYILLRPASLLQDKSSKNAPYRRFYAALCTNKSYELVKVYANGKLLFVDAVDLWRNYDNINLYVKLIKKLYKILEKRNSVISDDKPCCRKCLNAADVPDFMIERVLNGYA